MSSTLRHQVIGSPLTATHESFAPTYELARWKQIQGYSSQGYNMTSQRSGYQGRKGEELQEVNGDSIDKSVPTMVIDKDWLQLNDRQKALEREKAISDISCWSQCSWDDATKVYDESWDKLEEQHRDQGIICPTRPRPLSTFPKEEASATDTPKPKVESHTKFHSALQLKNEGYFEQKEASNQEDKENHSTNYN